MSFDLSETRLNSRDIADKLNVHPSQIVRWCRRGLLLSDGSRLRLPAVFVGRELRIREADLSEFITRKTEDRGIGVDDRPGPRSPARRQRESQHATRRLDAAGVGV